MKPRTRLLVVLAALVAAMAVTGHMRGRPSPDVAWNLYVARALLGGARLGVDVLENTPPMIFALKVPVVALAGMLHARESAVWSLFVAGLGVLAALLASSLARRPTDASQFTASMLAMTLVLLVLPGSDFGQRDHVTAILVLPYVCLAARRATGAGWPARAAVLVGVLAGVGIGIKPHFALLPVALTVAALRGARLRAVFVPENLAIGAVGLAYVLAVVRWTPGYLPYAALYGPLYQHFQTDFFVGGHFLAGLPPWASAAIGYGPVPAYVALGAFAALRPCLTDEERRWAAALALATAALLLVGILQGKGWRYHFLPSGIFAILTTGFLLERCRGRTHRPAARLYLLAGGALVAASFASVLPMTLVRFTHPKDRRLDADPNLPELLPLVQAVGPEGHVAVLSTNISSSFPLVLEGGAQWALRHPNLWPLVAFYPEQVRQSAVVQTRPLAARGPLERRFSEDVVSDLMRTEPSLLLVLRPNPATRGGGGSRLFDYLGYFEEVPAFRAVVLPNYRLAGRAGEYDVYWRLGSDAAPPDSAVAPRRR